MTDVRYDADEYPIEIVAGADFSKALVYYPDGVDADAQDWEGWSAVAQLRDPDDRTSGTPLAAFTVTLGSGGTVHLQLTDTQTGALEPGAAVYGVILTDPDGLKTPWLEGTATIRRAVSR